MITPRLFYLDQVESQIRDADLLLCRTKQGIGDRLIAAASRSPYVHAGMCARLDGRLYILDVLQFEGGRKRLLAAEIAEFPARYDLYTVDSDRWPGFSRKGAVDYMLEHYVTGQYGWLNVWRASLRHLAFIRLIVPPLVDDDANGDFPPFCSQAVATSSRRGGGVDPVRNLADRLTEPGDLGRSLFYRYAFTLTA